tara:strand:- start:319 stop:483 length:165 start_codon:yes stop_codon:yes gene_type:complete
MQEVLLEMLEVYQVELHLILKIVILVAAEVLAVLVVMQAQFLHLAQLVVGGLEV